MRKEDLDAIATREAHCKPYGASVTLSIGERDEMVALARDGMRYRWLRNDVLVDGEVNDALYVHVDSPDWPTRWALVGDELDSALDAAMAEAAARD